MLIDFFLPVYNEEKILEKNTLKLYQYLRKQNHNFKWRIVIIVNGSTDKSLDIAKSLATNFSKIKCLSLKRAGKGRALKQAWLQSAADIFVYMDIDLAVSLKNINSLIDYITFKNYDLTIGSRMLPESKIKRAFLRELSSQSYNFLSKIILGHNFSDLQCGFKAIKAPAFKTISRYLKNPNWFFDTELIIFAKRFNLKIKEMPVDWQEARYQERKSKVKIFRDGIKFAFNLIKLKKRILKNKKNR